MEAAQLRRQAKTVCRVLAVVVLLFSCSERQSGASIIVLESSIDIGEVYCGASARGVFRLENRGHRPLEITKISSSCGCMTTKASSDLIPAGGRILVTCETIAPRFPGRLSRSIDVYFNNHTSVNLRLDGNVLGYIIAYPTEVVIQRSDQLTPPSATVELISNDSSRFAVSGIDVCDPGIQVAYEPGLNVRQQLRVSRTEPNTPAGANVSFRLFILHPFQYYVTVKVHDSGE